MAATLITQRPHVELSSEGNAARQLGLTIADTDTLCFCDVVHPIVDAWARRAIVLLLNGLCRLVGPENTLALLCVLGNEKCRGYWWSVYRIGIGDDSTVCVCAPVPEMSGRESLVMLTSDIQTSR